MPGSSRRDFLRHTAAAGFGVFGLPSLPDALCRGARADAVIHIHLDGGLSHIDSFDPKPDAPVEVRGPFGTVKSKLAGEPLSDLLPRTAAIGDKLLLIRSCTHTEADHERGQHSVVTGYQPSPAVVYPSLGSVVAHELGGRNDLPPYVCIPAAPNRFFGTGYLTSAFAPFAVGGNPVANDFKVRDLDAPKDIDAARRQRRKELLASLDASAVSLGAADAVEATAAYYRQAWAMIESPAARAAFEVTAEPDAMKERYGRRPLGMGCLLARRLVQAGARYVVVGRGGFDHHQQIANALPPLLGELDQAFAALVADLDAQGLLERTLVLITSEFGRTPRLNQDGGRDHWPRVFSVMLAGGGLRRGLVLGSSDAQGADVASDPVHVADLAATVFASLGIDGDKRLLAPGGRPVQIVREGRVLDEALA